MLLISTIIYFFYLISKARYINKEAESYKYIGGIQSNKPLKKPTIALYINIEATIAESLAF